MDFTFFVGVIIGILMYKCSLILPTVYETTVQHLRRQQFRRLAVENDEDEGKALLKYLFSKSRK